MDAGRVWLAKVGTVDARRVATTMVPSPQTTGIPPSPSGLGSIEVGEEGDEVVHFLFVVFVQRLDNFFRRLGRKVEVAAHTRSEGGSFILMHQLCPHLTRSRRQEHVIIFGICPLRVFPTNVNG